MSRQYLTRTIRGVTVPGEIIALIEQEVLREVRDALRGTVGYDMGQMSSEAIDGVLRRFEVEEDA